MTSKSFLKYCCNVPLFTALDTNFEHKIFLVGRVLFMSCDIFSNIKKLGYTPKVISSSHWIFEYELGQPSEMEIPDIESKHFVDVTLFDIYGNVFQKSVNVSTTAWGRQRMKLEFKGMSQIDCISISCANEGFFEKICYDHTEKPIFVL